MKAFIKKLIPYHVMQLYYICIEFFAALIYGFPGLDSDLKIVGVTGTNGKSSTVYLATRILEEAGLKVASFSSLEYQSGKDRKKNSSKMTMPSRLDLQEFLRKAASNNVDVVVLESSSEGLEQNRHKFLNYDVGVFTNLTKEHIEAHGSFSAYKKAKARLFKALSSGDSAIFNLEDSYTDYFLETVDGDVEIWGYGTDDIPEEFENEVDEIVSANDWEVTQQGCEFSIEGYKFDTSLLGKFNIFNTLAAISIALEEEVDMEDVREAVESVESIPGRLELIDEGQNFNVIVDYAHTPDALQKVYSIASAHKYQNYADRPEKERKESAPNVIGVLGSAGGGRDKWKRPILGEIAAQYSDIIILTDEDPYDEDPKKIIEEVKSGVEDYMNNRNEKFSSPILMTKIDREEAIKSAISLALPGDIVVITGKGSESLMVTSEGKIPWDDREIARQAIKDKLGK